MVEYSRRKKQNSREWKSVMANKIEEMKYEGLAALIIEGQEHAKERHEDFKEFVAHRFTKLDDHNEWQNGSMHKMSDRVHQLEHKTEDIKKENNYVRLLKWIDTHPRRSIILILGSWSIMSIAITNAVCNNWLPRMWELIIKIVT